MNDYESHLHPDRGIFPLSELSTRGAAEFGKLPVMRTWNGSGYDEISYIEFNDRVTSIAQWLINCGMKRNDRIAILGENSPQWAMCYLAIQKAGGVVVPVDSLMPASGIRHIISDSGAKFLFVSGKFMTVVNEMEPVKKLQHIICLDSSQTTADLSFEDIYKKQYSKEIDFPERELDELAAILYTSGTTGYSKGVMLSQMNIMSNVAAASRVFALGTSDTFLSVLPVHHSFECTAGFLLPLYCGCSITFSHSLKSADLIADIKNTNVTLMVGVPLLFEKMHAGILRGIKKKGKKTQVLFNTLLKTVIAGEKMGASLGETLFKTFREKAGLSSVNLFVSGGGPLNPETALFFNRLGIKLLQGYGLTETSPVTHVNPPWKPDHITVGPPIDKVECKIVNPNPLGIGEIAIKGPNVFQGYYNNEEATSETFDEDDWFLTGDLGIIHDNNYLQIKGRKKNMIVTGGGKNVYPEEVEHFINKSKFISESLVLGIERDSGYGEDVGALISPDYEQIDLHFEQKGRKATPEDVHKLIKNTIRSTDAHLAEYKRIKRFRLMETEFEKTSTRKIKRYLYDGEMTNVKNGIKKN